MADLYAAADYQLVTHTALPISGDHLIQVAGHFVVRVAGRYFGFR
jgi:hypothetical protein